MQNAIVNLTPGTLPQGYCLTSLQQFYNDIINLTLAQIPGSYSLFNFGANIPDPADQDKPWLRTLADGSMDRWYTFNGLWVSPHAVPPNGEERRLWVGTQSDLWAYDGGDGTDPAAATDTTGSMWDIDGQFDLKFPYGADARSNSAGTVAPAGTGGLASASIGASHVHVFGDTGDGGDGLTLLTAPTVPIPSQSSNSYQYNSAGPVTNPSISTGKLVSAPASASESVATVPPFVGVYFIKRSLRVYYLPT